MIGEEDHYKNTPLILAEIYDSESCVNLLKSFTGSTPHNDVQSSIDTQLAGGVIHNE
ncbi:MAG TPA: hypothetical protein LFV90_00750 [Rickettsia endosymbiont of Columbicola hoogstraali]|nr:hypothetical protein [Rickettsia endosymbiont of Columbicola hoogstraali]